MFKRYFNTALKNISILLALTLTLTSVFGCIASAENEGTENTYIGTEADGYTGTGNIYDTPTPNEKFMNFDFEDGYKYWQKGNGTSEIITEDDENKALKLECDGTNKIADTFVYSYPITLKNVVAGAQFAIRVDLKAVLDENDTLKDNSRISFTLKSKDNSVTIPNDSAYKYLVTGNTDGYVTLSGTYSKISAVADEVTDVTLYLQISHYNVNADIYIDNILIGYQSDTNYMYDNQKTERHYLSLTDGVEALSAYTNGSIKLYDLAETGYYTGFSNVTNSITLKSDSFINGDFSKGFTGWGATNTDNTKAFPSDFAEITQNNECHITYSSGARMGLHSTLFPLTGLKTGDSVMVYFEYKWGDSENIESGADFIAEIRSKTNSDMHFSNTPYTDLKYTSANETTVERGESKALDDTGWNAVTTIPGKLQVDSPDVYISLRVNANKKNDIYIRNVKIIVAREYDTGNNTNLTYEFYGSDNDGKYYEKDGVTEAASPYGTVEDGITANGSDVSKYKIRKEVNILDFKNNGLKYWGAAIQDGSKIGNGTKASNCATVNNDGSVTLKYTSTSEMGISSVYFKLPETVTKNGTNYAVWFDYVRSDNDTESQDQNNLLTVIDSKVMGNENAASENSAGNSSGTLTLSAPAKTFNNDSEKYGIVSLMVNGTRYNYTVSNFHLGYVDKGGMDKTLYVCEDGTPRDGEMGDANADGELNILDLIRMKKRSSDTATKIYFAAADMDGDDTIGATDIATLKKALLK